MVDALSKYAWDDHLKDGTRCTRNVGFELHMSDVVPRQLCSALPFGHGVRVVNMGPRPGLVDALNDPESCHVVINALRQAMPEHCPAGTRVHFGIRRTMEQPVLQDRNSPVYLSVWGHDAKAAQNVYDKLRLQANIAEQAGKELTMETLMQSNVIQKANSSGQEYRDQLMQTMVNAIDKTFPDAIKGVSHVADITQFTVQSSEDCDTLRVGIDCNVGTSAVIFHSPKIGTTCLFPKDNDKTNNFLPSSNGRNVNYCAEATDKVSLDEAMAAAAKKTPEPPGLGTCVVTYPVGHNEYASVDAMESTYPRESLVSLFQLTKGEKYPVRSASLLTLVPGPQHVDCTLHGHIKCDSLALIDKYTNASSAHRRVPNTPFWREILVQADPAQSVSTYMRSDNQVGNSDSKVESFALTKDEIENIVSG